MIYMLPLLASVVVVPLTLNSLERETAVAESKSDGSDLDKGNREKEREREGTIDMEIQILGRTDDFFLK